MSDVNSKLPRGVDLPMPVGSDEAKIFSGPDNLSVRDEWRRQLNSWRNSAIEKFKYDDSAYKSPHLQSIDSFNVALVWLWDELLFDFELQVFTPEKLVADFERFGGLDGLILWHAYPVIGSDSRNQFDYYNEVPGLAALINKLQHLGVDVYLNYNPWDRWSNRPPRDDQYEIADLLRNFNFDGVFLDTMKSADPAFMEPIKSVNPHLIVAGESRVQQERICDHVMSWAQWFADSEIPGVIRAKWFERRHMLHQTRRWNQSHIDELFIAWLNGCGMLIWEVVFGSWVGWNARETLMWSEMVAILRAHNDLITEGDWEPLTKLSEEAELHGIYASKFSINNKALLTIINKNAADYSGEIIPGVSMKISGKGVSAILIDDGVIKPFEFTFDSQSSKFPERIPERLVELEGKSELLSISYRNRECGLYSGAPFIDAWKPLPPHYHQQFTQELSVKVREGKLHSSEVSNREYWQFMQETHYVPKVKNRFLNHWINQAPLPEDMDRPVTHINLDDAKAYAQWAGLVIPTEFEWQKYVDYSLRNEHSVMNLTDSVHTDGRTRFLILKGGSAFNVRYGQGAKSTSGIAESDWYVDGGRKDEHWVEKLLLLGLGLERSENIGFTCFEPFGGM